MVRCRIHLFLPPGWELGEGAAADPAAVLALLKSLRPSAQE
jgi:hypothetical protein